jgi:hypothetical protein
MLVNGRQLRQGRDRGCASLNEGHNKIVTLHVQLLLFIKALLTSVEFIRTNKVEILGFLEKS